MKKRYWFSFIELIISIVILWILIWLASISFVKRLETSEDSKTISDISSLKNKFITNITRSWEAIPSDAFSWKDLKQKENPHWTGYIVSFDLDDDLLSSILWENTKAPTWVKDNYYKIWTFSWTNDFWNFYHFNIGWLLNYDENNDNIENNYIKWNFSWTGDIHSTIIWKNGSCFAKDWASSCLVY